MKLKEYIEQLQKFAQENPASLEMDVIYARDDEGNGYCRGVMGPSFMQVDGDYHPDVLNDESQEDFEPNAVCIN